MKFNTIFARYIPDILLMAALLLTIMASPQQAGAHGVGAVISAAATPEQKNLAKEINRQLGVLITEYQSGNAAERSSLAVQLTKLAMERQQMMFDLLENDPAFVLSMALTNSKLSVLPYAVQNQFEQTEDIEGELSVLHIDDSDAQKSRYEYYLNTPSGQRLSLHFAANPPGLVSGDEVRAHGKVFNRSGAHAAEETDGAVLVESGDTGLLILAKGNPNGGGTGGSSPGTSSSALGEQRTLVILVNFSDNQTEPWTPAFAQSLVFGETSNFMFENSSQQTWVSGDVAGWFTIDLSSTVCDIYTLAYQAKNAATASGVILSNYRRIVYSFPKNGCGGLGLGTVGGNPSEAWIIGTPTLEVVSHELGHNLGLYHAKALDCGTTVLGDNCTVMGYGNAFDAMGNKNAGHYNAFMKERLGWLNAGVSPEIVTVESDGTYQLDAYESAGTGPKALKILKSTDAVTGAKAWYYIESRQAMGFDSFLTDNTNVVSGVLIHTGTEGNGDSSYLLDITPASEYLTTYDWLDPALISGESYSDANAGVTITADSVTTSGAMVTVIFGTGGGGTGTGSPPTVSVSTDLPSYTKGQIVTVTTWVNSGGNPVSNASVSFKITEPNGAITNSSATTGSDGTAVYKLRLRKQDPSGIYKAETVATKDSMSGSAATQFTVQ
ncbi:MAG: Ig-like domain-containing protein [Gammaproteobacteria bacterium]